MNRMVDRIFRIEVILFLNEIISGYKANIWQQDPHYFTVYLETRTWNEAREGCRSIYDHLVSITDETDSMFWTEMLNPTRLQDHRSTDRIYWTGLHAPDTNSPDSFFWDDCSLATSYEILNYNSTTEEYQCVAMYCRNLTDVALYRSMCYETYPFICSTYQNESDCVLSCDELVVLTDQNVCGQLCDNRACNTFYLNHLKMCHMVPKVYSSSTKFTICYLPSEEFVPDICRQKPEINPIDNVDTSETVTDTICMIQQLNGSISNTTSSRNCDCPCEKLWTFLPTPAPDTVNLTIAEKIEIIVNELSVDKKNTSVSLRRYVSVMDSRLSSMGIGIVAGIIIMAVIGIIIIMDLSKIWREIQSFLLSLFTILPTPNNSRGEINSDQPSARVSSFITSSGKPVDKVSSVGWFSRERLLYTSSDVDDKDIEMTTRG